jgi:hypothetical protein
MEVSHVERLIQFLTDSTSTNDLQQSYKDFKSFYQQYDLRRNKDFATAFPELKEWYNTL